MKGWRCTAHGCTRPATRRLRLVLTLHDAEAAVMRLCDSPACERSARASLASKIEVTDGV